jgi:hypothetical protein
VSDPAARIAGEKKRSIEKNCAAVPRFSFMYFQNHGSGGMPPEKCA